MIISYLKFVNVAPQQKCHTSHTTPFYRSYGVYSCGNRIALSQYWPDRSLQLDSLEYCFYELLDVGDFYDLDVVVFWPGFFEARRDFAV